MKNFIKLLNFEMNRFIKLYIGLLIVIAIIQITGIIVSANSYMKMINVAIKQGGMSQAEIIVNYEKYGITDVIVYTMWFMGPIAIGVAALLFYLFFIWYRDWFAKNTFIYRLLTLPTSRMNVYLAKVSTIMLTVLGLVAFQIILLVIQNNIIKWIVPKAYRLDYSVPEIIAHSPYLPIILPSGIFEFIVNYGLGFLFVVVIFTMILFERSYRLKGIIFGILYAATSFIIFTLPITIQSIVLKKFYLYPNEIVMIEVVMWVIVLVISLFVSKYLLKNKVTV